MPPQLAVSTDTSLVKPLLQAAYLRTEWTDLMVEEQFALEGLHTIDPDPAQPVYCHLVPRTVDEPIGPIPIGLATQVGTLIPEHHDQLWVNSKLAPLLAQSLRTYAGKYPDWLNRPFFGVLEYDLAALWHTIVDGKPLARYGTTHGIIWLPTLAEGLEAMRSI